MVYRRIDDDVYRKSTGGACDDVTRGIAWRFRLQQSIADIGGLDSQINFADRVRHPGRTVVQTLRSNGDVVYTLELKDIPSVVTPRWVPRSTLFVARGARAPSCDQ